MMAKLVSLKAGKGTVLIESAVSERTGRIQQAGGVSKKIGKQLSELLEIVQPITESILESVQNLSERPDTISAEFGLSVTAEGNIFVVKVAGEGTLKVTFSWENNAQGNKT
jgi:hypothetical protein